MNGRHRFVESGITGNERVISSREFISFIFIFCIPPASCGILSFPTDLHFYHRHSRLHCRGGGGRFYSKPFPDEGESQQMSHHPLYI